jgi:excisionase family DNA binding protein
MTSVSSSSLQAPLLTAGQVGALLGGIPTNTVLLYARDGRLPCMRIGKHVRFVRSDVDEALVAMRQGRSPGVTGGRR